VRFPCISAIFVLSIPIRVNSLLKRALELRKPVLYLNVGPTRADGLPGMDKLEIPTGAVMTDVVHAVM
jgi:NAD-dependent deacetylase sirtuin 4